MAILAKSSKAKGDRFESPRVGLPPCKARWRPRPIGADSPPRLVAKPLQGANPPHQPPQQGSLGQQGLYLRAMATTATGVRLRRSIGDEILEDMQGRAGPLCSEHRLAI